MKSIEQNTGKKIDIYLSLILDIIHAMKFQQKLNKTINKQEILILFTLFPICKIIPC
jgi:hypothetical protein